MNSPQPAPHEDAILARLEAMSEAELCHLITSERDDYLPRALELAEQELARRGAELTEAAQTSHREESSGRRWRTSGREAIRSSQTGR